MTRAPPVVGLLVQGGTGNLGDEATIASVIDELRRRLPDAELRAYTPNPRDTEFRHSIPAFPREENAPPFGDSVIRGYGQDVEAFSTDPSSRRMEGWPRRLWRALRPARAPARWAWRILRELRFLREAHRSLRGIELLIVPGSGPVSDIFGGTWGKPYSLLRWVILARARRIDVVVFSVGAGPIDRRPAAWMLRLALRLARRRSYRDPASRDLMESLGAPRGDPVIADVVLGARWLTEGHSSEPASELGTVGVNLLPYGHPICPIAPGAQYEPYLERMAEFVEWLTSQGRRVVLFPSQIRVDPKSIDDLLAILASRDRGTTGRVSVREVRDLDELAEVVSCVDAVAASRYHGVVLPLTLRKPVLGIAYQEKTMDLLRMFGMQDFCAPASQLEAGELPARFTRLEEAWSSGELRWDALDDIVAARDREIQDTLKLCDPGYQEGPVPAPLDSAVDHRVSQGFTRRARG